MPHPVLAASSAAVVTGGASGIGLAAAHRFATLGMKVAVLDIGSDRLDSVAKSLAAAGAKDVLALACDVSDVGALRAVESDIRGRFGEINILMNNAGIQPGSTIFGPEENWQKVMAVNLWGIVHGTQVFVPNMIAQAKPGLVINTGSKQGITTPPGDPAYNVAKAGVKAFTEALQHELRNTEGCQLTAHLLIPGFVYTGLSARRYAEKPPAAWTPEQTVDFMFERIEVGDFYILCPDNDVTRAMDERRMLWAAGDVAENRPPLSRWHPDYKDAFAAFLEKH